MAGRAMSIRRSVNTIRRASTIRTVAMAWLCLIPWALSGCAVYKEASAPPLKDLSVLKPGTARDRVIAELGTPVSTEMTATGRKDLFTFIQGYSSGSRSGLATVIALEDIATLGA